MNRFKEIQRGVFVSFSQDEYEKGFMCADVVGSGASTAGLEWKIYLSKLFDQLWLKN